MTFSYILSNRCCAPEGSLIAIRQPTENESRSAPLVQERIDWARARYHLDDKSLVYQELADDGDPPVVLGDIEELRAVLTNLLDNAVKYSLHNNQVSVEAGPLDNTHAVIRVNRQWHWNSS